MVALLTKSVALRMHDVIVPTIDGNGTICRKDRYTSLNVTIGITHNPTSKSAKLKFAINRHGGVRSDLKGSCQMVASNIEFATTVTADKAKPTTAKVSQYSGSFMI